MGEVTAPKKKSKLTAAERKVLDAHAGHITDAAAKTKFVEDVTAKALDVDTLEERNPGAKNASLVLVKDGKIVARITTKKDAFVLKELKRPRSAVPVAKPAPAVK